jgi:hypothetical protein
MNTVAFAYGKDATDDGGNSGLRTLVRALVEKFREKYGSRREEVLLQIAMWLSWWNC